MTPSPYDLTSLPLLERAIAYATVKHAGQVDKGGQPYILHPLRVMAMMRDEESRIVAVLHDVVEDSDASLSELRRLGMPPAVVSCVGVLTRRQNESYTAFIERVAAYPVARRVKLADLHDNLDASRIPNPGPEDWARMAKYDRAETVLLKRGLRL